MGDSSCHAVVVKDLMNAFKRLLSYVKPYWWRIVIAALASMAVGGMDGAFAYFISPLLTKIFQSHDLYIFKLLPLGIIAIFVARGICRYLDAFFMPFCIPALKIISSMIGPKTIPIPHATKEEERKEISKILSIF